LSKLARLSGEDAVDALRAYYVAIAAIAVAIVWILFKAAPIRQKNDFDEIIPLPREKTRRDELMEARDRITRQIEILRSPVQGRDFTRLSRQNIEKLQAVLDEIEAELSASERG
jgi:hypothetical protein